MFADQFISSGSDVLASDNVRAEDGERRGECGAECHDVTIVTRGLNTFNINIRAQSGIT